MSNQNEQGQTEPQAKEREPITIVLSVELQKKIEELYADAMDHPIAKSLKAVVESVMEKDPETGAKMQEAWYASFGKVVSPLDVITKLIEGSHESLQAQRKAESTAKVGMAKVGMAKVGMVGMGGGRLREALELAAMLKDSLVDSKPTPGVYTPMGGVVRGDFGSRS
jgi:hypothetical protein